MERGWIGLEEEVGAEFASLSHTYDCMMKLDLKFPILATKFRVAPPFRRHFFPDLTQIYGLLSPTKTAAAPIQKSRK